MWLGARWLGAMVFGVAVAVAAGHSREIYVAVDGDDSTVEIGNPARPFKSLTVAFRSLQNGDTLRIASGRYEVTPGYPVTYFPLPDYAPMPVDGLTNVVIQGVGDVEIFGAGPGDFLMIQNSDSVRVENVTLTGDWPSIPENGDEAALFSTIMLRGTNNAVHIENCRFFKFGDHAVSHLWGPKTSFNMVVTNCYFEEGGDGDYDFLELDGAAISGISPGSRIMNNVFVRCWRGIEVEGVFNQPITNVLIEGNIIRDGFQCGIMLFATDPLNLQLPDSYSDIRILNNYITGMKPHPDFPHRVTYGIYLLGGRDLEIIGNTVTNSPNGYGIVVTTQQMPVQNATISGNTVIDNRMMGIALAQWITNSLETGNISSNTVLRSGQIGISVNGRNISISSNIVEDCAWEGPVGGISVGNAFIGSENVTVEDNVIRNSTQWYSDFGIKIDPGARNTLVVGNSFANAPEGAIRDDGTGTRSLPKIKTIQRTHPNVNFTVSGVPHSNYRLEVAHDFTNWITVCDVQCPESGQFQCSYTADPPRLAPTRTLFRIVQLPSPE